jgi:hypothetical protein
MRALGVPDGHWQEKHCMVPCLSVTLDETAVAAFEARLLQLSVNGITMRQSSREIAPLSFDRKSGISFHIFVYFEAYDGATVAELGNRHIEFEELGFGFFAHEDNVACSARHTPEGSLIVYDPASAHMDHKRMMVSTLEVAPAILENFNISVPEYMHTPDPLLLDVGKAGIVSEFRIDSPARQEMLQRVD